MNEDLSKEDWQVILNYVHWQYEKHRPDNPPPSKAWKDQEDRIIKFLLKKAFG
jgi:hypothetical protein